MKKQSKKQNNETVEPIQEEPNNEPAIENVVGPTEEVANEQPEVKSEPKRKNHPYP